MSAESHRSAAPACEESQDKKRSRETEGKRQKERDKKKEAAERNIWKWLTGSVEVCIIHNM